MKALFKILCLHGYYQNASRFRMQTGSLRKILNDEAVLYYISAPNQIPGTKASENDVGLRAWWFSKPSSFRSTDVTDMDKGFNDSIDIIKKTFKEEGPFDGLLGFSQGAAVVGLLCAMKEINEIDLDFKFAILFCGFKSLSTLHTKYYNKTFNTPSLHVIGAADEIVAPHMSYGLAEKFDNPVILQHPGGHYVPGKSIYKNNYLDFLQAQRK